MLWTIPLESYSIENGPSVSCDLRLPRPCLRRCVLLRFRPFVPSRRLERRTAPCTYDGHAVPIPSSFSPPAVGYSSFASVSRGNQLRLRYLVARAPFTIVGPLPPPLPPHAIRSRRLLAPPLLTPTPLTLDSTSRRTQIPNAMPRIRTATRSRVSAGVFGDARGYMIWLRPVCARIAPSSPRA